MSEPRVIAVARDYRELVAALRSWVVELGTSGETIDHVAGIATRYTSKLLAPLPIKHLSHQTMGPVLGALGLKLIVAVDEEILAKMRPRLTRRHNAGGKMLAGKKPRKYGLTGDSQWGFVMACRQNVLLSPKQRSARARHAAKVRWANRAADTPQAV